MEKAEINSTKITVKNKDQMQSYILTAAKYDYNVYEKRILYKLVEMAQCELAGLEFPANCKKLPNSLGTEITIPIADILANEKDKNHALVKKSLVALSKKGFDYEDDMIWMHINIVFRPMIRKNSSTITFIIAPELWDCMLDFSKGYRKYELAVAMRFKSVYSMRFYELISGQKKKLTFTLEYLKSMFCIGSKYEFTANFIKKVIEPAKKELDSCSPYSFDFVPVKEGRKIVAFEFHPIFNHQHRDAELYKKELSMKTGLSWDLNKAAMNFLKKRMNFTVKEINANRDTFVQAQMVIPDLMNEMEYLCKKSELAKNPKGWFINSIKNMIANPLI